MSRPQSARSGAWLRTAARLLLAAGCLLPALAPTAARAAGPAPAGPTRTVNSVLPGPLGASAEATAALDPARPGVMAVGEDPYLASTHIQVGLTTDGGRHWSAAIDVLPPGMRKSYDPQLAFAADGSLLVVGGASPDAQPDCQRASIVFLAVVRGGQVSYTTLATAPAGGLLDRPTFAVDAPLHQFLVAWTASPGPDAACRLRPEAATTVVARVSDGLQVLGTTILPRAAVAPFGSSLAVDGSGAIGLVTAARDDRAALQIVVYRSTDGAGWTATTVGRGTAQGDELAGLGGDVLSMPTITGLTRGFAVAWSDASSGVAQTRLTEDRSGTWLPVPGPPAVPAAATLVPTVGAQGEDLLLIQAVRTATGLRYDTWQQAGGGWVRVAADDSGPIADRHELGEALGLATTPAGELVTAAPVDEPGASALLVRTSLPPPVVARQPRPVPGSAAPAAHSGGALPVWPVVAAVGAAALAAGTLGRRRRRRRG